MSSAERFAKKEIISMNKDFGLTRMRVSPIEGLINLSAGDPDFDQPEFINRTVYEAMKAGYTHYSFTGEPDFKESIAEYYIKYGVNLDPMTQVSITSGGSQGIFLAFSAFLNPGDEIIIMDPAYQGYNQPAEYFGAKLVRARQKKSREGLFRPNFESIENAVSKNTKAILICNPDNPCGSVWTKKELEILAGIAIEKDLIVMSDEIYTEYVWNDNKHSTIIDIPGMMNRTLVLMSFSKTFAWTGCRAGYVIAGPDLMKIINLVPTGICSVPVPFQKAGVKALEEGWGFVDLMRKEYQKRVDYMVKRLNEIEGIFCPYPQGTFYVLPDISSQGISSRKFVAELYKKEKVRCAPGTQYGEMGEGHIRFSYANSRENIEKGMDIFEKVIGKLL